MLTEKFSLKCSYDDVIYTVDDQRNSNPAALMEEMCYAEKKALFCHNPWEYVGQFINQLADSRINANKLIILLFHSFSHK